MWGLICWLLSMVLLLGLAYGVYRFLQEASKRKLAEDEKLGQDMAAERKRKRIAEHGYDPLDPNDPRNKPQI